MTCKTCRHGHWCLERDRRYPCRNYSRKEETRNEKSAYQQREDEVKILINRSENSK